MTIATFNTICQNPECGHTFEVPVLSDFNYGEFIYFSTNGRSVRYYCGLGDSVWNVSNGIVEKEKSNIDSLSQGKTIQKIIGFLADSPSQEIHFTTNIICPKCRATIQSVDVSEKIEVVQVEPLTFSNFNSLTNNQKQDKIATLIKDMQEQ